MKISKKHITSLILINTAFFLSSFLISNQTNNDQLNLNNFTTKHSQSITQKNDFDLYDSQKLTLSDIKENEAIKTYKKDREDYWKNQVWKYKKIFDDISAVEPFNTDRKINLAFDSVTFTDVESLKNSTWGNSYEIKYRTNISIDHFPITFVKYSNKKSTNTNLESWGIVRDKIRWDGYEYAPENKWKVLDSNSGVNGINWLRNNDIYKSNVVNEFYFETKKETNFGSQKLEFKTKLTNSADKLKIFSKYYKSGKEINFPNFLDINEHAIYTTENVPVDPNFYYSTAYTEKITGIASSGYEPNWYDVKNPAQRRFSSPIKMSKYYGIQKRGSKKHAHLAFGYADVNENYIKKIYNTSKIYPNEYNDDIYSINFDNMFYFEPKSKIGNIQNFQISINDKKIKKDLIDNKKFVSIGSKFNYQLQYTLNGSKRTTSWFNFKDILNGYNFTIQPYDVPKINISNLLIKIKPKNDYIYRLMGDENLWRFKLSAPRVNNIQTNENNEFINFFYNITNLIDLDSSIVNNLYPSELLDYKNLRKLFKLRDHQGYITLDQNKEDLKIKVIPDDTTGKVEINYYDFIKQTKKTVKFLNLQVLKKIGKQKLINPQLINSEISKNNKILDYLKISYPTINEYWLKKIKLKPVDVNDLSDKIEFNIEINNTKDKIFDQWNKFYNNKKIEFTNPTTLAPKQLTKTVDNDPRSYNEKNIWNNLFYLTPETSRYGILRNDYQIKLVPETNKLTAYFELNKNGLNGQKQFEFRYNTPPEIISKKITIEPKENISKKYKPGFINNKKEENKNDQSTVLNDNTTNNDDNNLIFKDKSKSNFFMWIAVGFVGFSTMSLVLYFLWRSIKLRKKIIN